MNGAPANYEISTDRNRLDVGLIHGFLRETDWARDIPREVVERSIENSLCFGAFQGDAQVGFARVVTDFVCLAYVADVFVLPQHRGRGVARRLMQAVVDHPALQLVRRLLLATQDAHGLYTKFGFQPLAHPDHYLTLHRPGIYQELKPAGD
ncbi:MAG: GNAT family N-acetyltransferase [Verrucomicrobiae bacterium]|nr:GNAT family N-acetyltransferase [Verrucomicrobiae bacterium]MCP5522890.1 GNAT family N-acetyltransferase [Verrucomicrobiales bacterium]